MEAEFDMMKHVILITEKMIRDDFWDNEELKKYAVDMATRIIKNLGYCADVDCDECIFNRTSLGDVFKKHKCAYLDDRDCIVAACKQLLDIINEKQKEIV